MHESLLNGVVPSCLFARQLVSKVTSSCRSHYLTVAPRHTRLYALAVNGTRLVMVMVGGALILVLVFQALNQWT
jgi:hypothetical protein